jgi:carbon monoxide dehydrogenase subunit G
MDLTHRFTVPAPLPDAWAAFNDVETLAPCFPGATVSSADGADFAGLIKIKIGPLGLVYEGTGGYLERNTGAHRTVIQTRGRDKRGNGTAVTTITATFAARGDRTEIALHTDLDLSGKPARFGREVVTDVVDRVVDQFSHALAGKFAEGEVAAPAAPPDLRRRSLPGEAESAVDEPIAAAAEADFLDAEDSTLDEFPADTEPTIELGAVPGDFDESADGRTEIEEELDLPAPDEIVASESAAEPAPPPPTPRQPAPRQPAAPRAYVPPQNTAQPHVHVAGTMTSDLTKQLKQYGPALAIISVVVFLAIRILRGKR